jgi:hypothetical protein
LDHLRDLCVITDSILLLFADALLADLQNTVSPGNAGSPYGTLNVNGVSKTLYDRHGHSVRINFFYFENLSLDKGMRNVWASSDKKVLLKNYVFNGFRRNEIENL